MCLGQKIWFDWVDYVGQCGKNTLFGLGIQWIWIGIDCLDMFNVSNINGTWIELLSG